MKKLYITLSVYLLGISGFVNAQTVTTLAGSTTGGSANGTGAAASFNWPIGEAADNSGNLYVADYDNSEIRKIVISTGVVTTFAGSTTGGSANGIGSAASFSQPTGVTFDGGSNLFIADYANNEIRQIVISTVSVTTLAGSTTAGSANGTGAAAGFNHPTGLVTDGKGNLYVADEYNNEIRKIVIATGAVTTFAGSGAAGFANGTGTAATFNEPYGITCDGTNLYVGELGNGAIRQIVLATAVVTTVTSGLNQPWGVVPDGKGNLFVAVAAANDIDMVVISTGVTTVIAGSTSFASGSTNGIGTAATFFAPCGICLDNHGNLFIGDRNNNEMRAIMGIEGINELNVSNDISLYPNPANQMVNVSFAQPLTGEGILRVMDITGRVISEQKVNALQNTLSVNVAYLPQGIYFLSIEDSQGVTLVKKFVRE